jgi:VWFA-related protein
MRTSTALYLASLLALTALPALSAPQAGEDDLTFFETVDVNVVNIEVVVVGPGGAPVRGLTRDDFELFEDGRSVEIGNFYSVDAPPPPALDPTAPLATQGRVEPAEQQLHLGIFIDGLSLQPAQRRRVLDSIQEFFNYQAARPTSLTLAGFDGNLSVESMPRFNPDELSSHLEALKSTAARGALRELDRRTLLRDLNEANVTLGESGGVVDDFRGPAEASRLLTAVEIYAEQRYEEARLSAAALKSIVEALAGLPGRKALLYVSGGLSRNPGEAMYRAWENKFSDFTRTLGVNVAARSRALDTTPEISELIRFANSNRVRHRGH